MFFSSFSCLAEEIKKQQSSVGGSQAVFQFIGPEENIEKAKQHIEDRLVILQVYKPCHDKTGFLHMRKTKMQISFAVTTAKLISTFVFATQIVQSLYFLNPKFQASSYLMWLYSLVCVGPRIPVFSQRGSYWKKLKIGSLYLAKSIQRPTRCSQRLTQLSLSARLTSELLV